MKDAWRIKRAVGVSHIQPGCLHGAGQVIDDQRVSTVAQDRWTELPRRAHPWDRWDGTKGSGPTTLSMSRRWRGLGRSSKLPPYRRNYSALTGPPSVGPLGQKPIVRATTAAAPQRPRQPQASVQSSRSGRPRRQADRFAGNRRRGRQEDRLAEAFRQIGQQPLGQPSGNRNVVCMAFPTTRSQCWIDSARRCTSRSLANGAAGTAGIVGKVVDLRPVRFQQLVNPAADNYIRLSLVFRKLSRGFGLRTFGQQLSQAVLSSRQAGS